MDYLLLLVVLAFVGLVVVLPLLRYWRRTGEIAVVIRPSAAPIENLVRVATVIMLLAVVAWAVVVANVGLSNIPTFVDPMMSWPFALFTAGCGLALIIVAQVQMGLAWRIGIDDRPTELCVVGLFRWVRHPIYSGILLCLVAIVALVPSPWSLVIAVPGMLLVALQAHLEDAHMLAQHGDAFVRWAAETGRFLPGVGKNNGAQTVACRN